MKRAVSVLVIMLLFSGCASMKKIFFGWPTWDEVENEEGDVVRIEKKEAAERKEKIKRAKASLIVDKRQAIARARSYAQEMGFDDAFNLKKPSKLRRYLTKEQDPQWRWEVYFPAKDRNKWKFWKRSPILIEINGSTGDILSWGRR